MVALFTKLFYMQVGLLLWWIIERGSVAVVVGCLKEQTFENM